jgi:hypothetical protein
VPRKEEAELKRAHETGSSSSSIIKEGGHLLEMGVQQCGIWVEGDRLNGLGRILSKNWLLGMPRPGWRTKCFDGCRWGVIFSSSVK